MSSVEKQILRSAQDDKPTCHPEQSEGSALSAVIAKMAAIIGDANEARDLISMMHGQPRHWATLTPGAVVDEARALSAARERARGAPLEYAAQRAAFRYLMLHVDERVLIPRPETELLVDIVLEALEGESGGTVVDVGTGSGAIAIALATEGSFERVIATDISSDALEVASENVATCGASVELRHGSLLAPVTERNLRAVVSNPPYIAFEEASSLPAAVRNWEPAVALFSANNGMDTTVQLVRAASEALAPRGILALEVDVRRASLVAELCALNGAFVDVRIQLDLTGRERFVVARKREEQA